MLCLWQFTARAVATIAIVLGLSGSAWAVAAVGLPKRVDVDPKTTPIHHFGLFFVTRSPTGGFVVGWEQNTKAETPTAIYEGLRFRVFNNSFAPVAAPKSPDVSARREPVLWRVVPLGTASAYLIYGLSRDNNNPDNPEVREIFGQRIGLTTGSTAGARANISTLVSENQIAIGSGLSGGRAVVAWYKAFDQVQPAPGRFISSAGVAQPVSLNFTCCGTIKEAQLVRLQPLGTGFLAAYQRNSIFGNSGTYARVFQSNGQPLAAAKYFAVNFNDTTQNVHRNVHVPQALSNGNIAVFRFVPATNPTKLVAQLYSKTWQKIGSEKTLIPNFASTRYVDFGPTLDGGLFVIRTLLNNGVYTRQVQRFNASLVKVGADYTFPAAIFDAFRVAALSANRAVVLYRDVVGGRSQLKAQIVSY